MLSRCLPLGTPFDPAEDPPGSIDPLGTVAGAEQLADLLFSGMTARMWRARHLTFTALAAQVAEQATSASGDEELRLESRLALERLFVSAIARQEATDGQWKRASRRLPGIGLARQALAAGDQPLGKRTFLKGQAINGPFGVVSRLARQMDIIDDDNRLSGCGQELLRAWAADQDFDDGRSSEPGGGWIGKLAHFVTQNSCGPWPSRGWSGWENLAERLRPDKIGPRERRVIHRLLTTERDPLRVALRPRCIELLREPDAIANYRIAAGSGGRGQRDQEMLVSTFRALLEPTKNSVDRTMDFAILLIDAYEQVAAQLEFVLRGLCWALAHSGGRAPKAGVLADRALASHLIVARTALHDGTLQLQARLVQLAEHPQIQDAVGVERLNQLLRDAQAGLHDNQELVDKVLERHYRVQRQKKKGNWIEVDEHHWTLMSGFGDVRDDLLAHDGGYLHPFRVANAYSFLTDLRLVPAVEVSDGEET